MSSFFYRKKVFLKIIMYICYRKIKRFLFMLQKTLGIVLHSLKYNDSSNVVDIYTSVHGRQSFIVSITKSRRAGVKSVLFQPLSILEFDADFRITRSLLRIKDVKSYYPFSSIPYKSDKTAMAIFISEFLYRALQEENENPDLFAYMLNSIQWLDTAERDYANFHLVFLMRLSRFLGLFPNIEKYKEGCFFDLLDAEFINLQPVHKSFLFPGESSAVVTLLRMNYDNMRYFTLNRLQRQRCLEIINEYYRLHIPDFPQLQSLKVLQEIFD